MESYDLQKILQDTENKYRMKNHLSRMVDLYSKNTYETEAGYKKMTDRIKEILSEEIKAVSLYISILEEGEFKYRK